VTDRERIRPLRGSEAGFVCAPSCALIIFLGRLVSSQIAVEVYKRLVVGPESLAPRY
jgi:hypothetical protein